MKMSKIVFITASLWAAMGPAQARDDYDLDDVTMQVLEDFVAEKGEDRVRIIELPAAVRGEHNSSRERDPTRGEGREGDRDRTQERDDDHDSSDDSFERDSGDRDEDRDEDRDREDSGDRDDDDDRYDRDSN